MFEQGQLYDVDVAGYGKRLGVFLDRTRVTDVQVGDFVKVQFMGGLAPLVVRIGSVKVSGDERTFEFDWNGFRDDRPGGSLLADGITQSGTEWCKEVWRQPVCDHCDKVATLMEREGSEIYCATCGRDLFDQPREDLSVLTVHAYRKRRFA